MDPCELTLSITAAANAVAQCYDDDQLAIVGAIFSQLGDTVTTISVQRAYCKAAAERSAAQPAAEESANNAGTEQPV